MSSYFLETPQKAAHKKQMPLIARQGAWSFALSRARRLRSSERSVRLFTGEADGPGAGFQQEGQNKQVRFLEVLFNWGHLRASRNTIKTLRSSSFKSGGIIPPSVI